MTAATLNVGPSTVTPTASSVLQTARAALNVWRLGLPCDEVGIDRQNVSTLQVSLRGIGELLDEAVAAADKATKDGPSMAMYFGRDFVAMIENSLWQFMAFEIDEPPSVSDVRATVSQALAYLSEAEEAVPVGQTAAAEVAHG